MCHMLRCIWFLHLPYSEIQWYCIQLGPYSRRSIPNPAPFFTLLFPQHEIEESCVFRNACYRFLEHQLWKQWKNLTCSYISCRSWMLQIGQRVALWTGWQEIGSRLNAYPHLKVSEVLVFCYFCYQLHCVFAMAGSFVCSYCASKFMQFGKFERHLRDYHQNLLNFQVECPVSSCKTNLKSVHNLSRHIERKHHSLLTSWLAAKFKMPAHDFDAGSVHFLAYDTD
jgi:hypothetical protein